MGGKGGPSLEGGVTSSTTGTIRTGYTDGRLGIGNYAAIREARFGRVGFSGFGESDANRVIPGCWRVS